MSAGRRTIGTCVVAALLAAPGRAADPPVTSWRRTLEPCPSPSAIHGVYAGPSLHCDAAPPACTRHVDAGTLPRKPKVLRDVRPSLPSGARTAGAPAARVRYEIGLSGRVLSVTLVKGDPALGAAVIEAVSRRVYTPTLVDGCPMFVTVEEDVQFAAASPRPSR